MAGQGAGSVVFVAVAAGVAAEATLAANKATFLLAVYCLWWVVA